MKKMRKKKTNANCYEIVFIVTFEILFTWFIINYEFKLIAANNKYHHKTNQHHIHEMEKNFAKLITWRKITKTKKFMHGIKQIELFDILWEKLSMFFSLHCFRFFLCFVNKTWNMEHSTSSQIVPFINIQRASYSILTLSQNLRLKKTGKKDKKK